MKKDTIFEDVKSRFPCDALAMSHICNQTKYRSQSQQIQFFEFYILDLYDVFFSMWQNYVYILLQLLSGIYLVSYKIYLNSLDNLYPIDRTNYYLFMWFMDNRYAPSNVSVYRTVEKLIVQQQVQFVFVWIQH